MTAHPWVRNAFHDVVERARVRSRERAIDSDTRWSLRINDMAHMSDRLPGAPVVTNADATVTATPGRTTLAAEQPAAAAPIGAAPAGASANDVSALYVLLNQQLSRFIDARTQYARIARDTAGPGVEALRAELAQLARTLAATLAAQAPMIRELDSIAINELAIACARALEQSPEALLDLTIAQDLSIAAAALEVALGASERPAGAPALATLARVAGVFSGVAGIIYNGGALVTPGGNAGDALAVGGGILGVIAAARGSTPLGIASIVVEQLGTAIANSIRSGSDRDAIEAALVREGVEQHAAHAIAHGDPEIMRELRDYGISSARVVELAIIAPNLLTNGNPILTPSALREIIRWGSSPLTADRVRVLQMWNGHLAR